MIGYLNNISILNRNGCFSGGGGLNFSVSSLCVLHLSNIKDKSKLGDNGQCRITDIICLLHGYLSAILNITLWCEQKNKTSYIRETSSCS